MASLRRCWNGRSDAQTSSCGWVIGGVYDAATLEPVLGSKSEGTVIEATVPQESKVGLLGGL
jgi:hypothetical protein